MEEKDSASLSAGHSPFQAAARQEVAAPRAPRPVLEAREATPGLSTPKGPGTQDLPNFGFKTPMSTLLDGSLTPPSGTPKVAIDIRNLDSDRFKTLRADTAKLSRSGSKSGARPSEEVDDDFQVMVTPTIARALANVNARTKNSGEQTPPARRRFDLSPPPPLLRAAADESVAWPEDGGTQWREGPPPPRQAASMPGSPGGSARRTSTTKPRPALHQARGESSGSPAATPAQRSPSKFPSQSAAAKSGSPVPKIRSSFEARSPAEILRAAGADVPRPKNAYEVTPNPLFNDPLSPRDGGGGGTDLADRLAGASAGASSSDRCDESCVCLPTSSSDGAGASGEAPAQTSGDGSGAAAEQAAGAASRMTHRRTFSIDLDSSKAPDAPPPTCPSKPSEGEPVVSPAGSVEVREDVSPTEAGTHTIWRKPGYAFPQLQAPAFSFRPGPAAPAARGAPRPQHPAVAKLSPRSRAETQAAAAPEASAARVQAVELPPEEGLPHPCAPSPTNSSMASSPDRTEYKDGVNSPNTAIRAQTAQTPWLSKVQDFISSPSCSGGSARSEAPRSRLSPRALEVPPSRLVLASKEAGGFGSPLTVSEASAAKGAPPSVHRSDTASSWSIAANIPEGCEAPQRLPPWEAEPPAAGAKVQPFALPTPGSEPTPRRKRVGLFGMLLTAAIIGSVTFGGGYAVVRACGNRPLAACLLPRAPIHAHSPPLEPTALASVAARAKEAARAVLAFGKGAVPPEGGGEETAFPHAPWYSQLRDRASAALQCAPPDAAWLCSVKSLLSRAAATADRILYLAGNAGTLDLFGSKEDYLRVAPKTAQEVEAEQIEPKSEADEPNLQTVSEPINEAPAKDSEDLPSPPELPRALGSEHETELDLGSDPTASAKQVHPDPALPDEEGNTLPEVVETTPLTEESDANNPHENIAADPLVPHRAGDSAGWTRAAVDLLAGQPLKATTTALLALLAVLAAGFGYAKIFVGERVPPLIDGFECTPGPSYEPEPSASRGLSALRVSLSGRRRAASNAFDDTLTSRQAPGTPPPGAAAASEPSSTWLPSRLTPHRIAKVDSPPSKLAFREMRDRTIVTSDGRQVADLAPGAHIPEERQSPPGETPRTRKPPAKRAAAAKPPSTAARTASRSRARRGAVATAADEVPPPPQPSSPPGTRRVTRARARV